MVQDGGRAGFEASLDSLRDGGRAATDEGEEPPSGHRPGAHESDRSTLDHRIGGGDASRDLLELHNGDGGDRFHQVIRK